MPARLNRRAVQLARAMAHQLAARANRKPANGVAVAPAPAAVVPPVPTPRALHSPSIGPIPVETITYLGHPFHYLPNSQVGKAVADGYEWDNILCRIIEALVPEPDPLICEVGSNIGASLMEILKVRPAAEIVSFEPSDLYRTVLLENLRLAGFSHIDVVPHLVGATPGEGVIFTDDTSGSQTDYPHWNRKQAATIVTLDDHLAGRGPVRFLKTDTDGFDLDCLRGAAGILERDRPVLFLEFCPLLMPTDPAEELAWLMSMGYPRLVCLDNLGYAVGVTEDVEQAVRWSKTYVYCDILAAPLDRPGIDELIDGLMLIERKHWPHAAMDEPDDA